jgi:hypothetical protein
MGRPKSQPKTLREKTEKEFPDFVKEVDGLNIQEMEKRISNYAKELEDSEQHKEDNQALKDAHAEVTELAGPYKDVKKAVKVKTRYLIASIREKGGQ